MTETWDFLESPTADATMNMAVDEAFLRTAAERARPLLRVYSWLKPAVSIGYFQKFPAHLSATHEVVRRPTGGGIVYHGEDVTYTVVAPPGHRLSVMATADAYCALHKAVAAALDLQHALHEADVRSPRGQYECFQNPVTGDVVAYGRKLAGGAQRRTKWGLLHQGSIAKRITAEDLQEGFRQVLGVEFQIYQLSATEIALAEQLVREKYSTTKWNQRSG